MSMKSIKVNFEPVLKRLNFFQKRNTGSNVSGSYKSFQRHKGIEFEEFRNFGPGDDATLIDWRVSLRSGKLLARNYSVLKNANIIIMLDVSNSMLFSSIDKLKCEYAAELAGALGYYFLSSLDSVGIVMFNDDVVNYMPTNIGQKQFYLMRKMLSDPKNYGGQFSFYKPLNFVEGLDGGGSFIIIISDFIGLKENWFVPFSLISKKSDILSIIVRDPQDISLKSKVGRAMISDPFSDSTKLVDLEKINKSYEIEVEKQMNEIKKGLRSSKSEFLFLTTDKSFVNPLITFFSKRKRR